MTRDEAQLDAHGPESVAEDENEGLSRRVVVQHLALASGGSVLLAGCKSDPKPSTIDAGKAPEALVSSHRTFTNAEWATLTAAVDRFLPRDQDPGGLDAGVPEYIDRMLQTEPMQQMRKNFVPGLAALDRRAQRLFQKPFAQATPAQQDEALTVFKNSPESSGEARWYEMLMVLCLEGFLGDPSYGGNQGEVGWALVGFQLVGRNAKGDPHAPYDGTRVLHQLVCGGGKGC